jgi:hypothetical protein
MAKSTGISSSSWNKTVTQNTSTPNLTDQIRKKAQELWEKNGRKPGQDLKNWLEAEKLVKSGKA